MKIFSGHQMSAFPVFHGQEFRIVRKGDIYHINTVIVIKYMGFSFAELYIVLLVPCDHGYAVAGQNHEEQEMDDKKRPPAEAGCFYGCIQLICHAAKGRIDKQDGTGSGYQQNPCR